jgi:hypothetical protein
MLFGTMAHPYVDFTNLMGAILERNCGPESLRIDGYICITEWQAMIDWPPRFHSLKRLNIAAWGQTNYVTVRNALCIACSRKLALLEVHLRTCEGMHSARAFTTPPRVRQETSYVEDFESSSAKIPRRSLLLYGVSHLCASARL